MKTLKLSVLSLAMMLVLASGSAFARDHDGGSGFRGGRDQGGYYGDRYRGHEDFRGRRDFDRGRGDRDRDYDRGGWGRRADRGHDGGFFFGFGF